MDWRLRPDRTGCRLDPGAMTTRARKSGDGYVLSGQMRITNADCRCLYRGASFWTRTARIPFVVLFWSAETKGSTRQKSKASSHSGRARLGEIVLADVAIPGSRILPGVREVKGPAPASTGPCGIAWGALGCWEFCWPTRTYGLNRRQFGKPLAGTQLYQKKLADMQTEITLGLSACRRVTCMAATGFPTSIT